MPIIALLVICFKIFGQNRIFFCYFRGVGKSIWVFSYVTTTSFFWHNLWPSEKSKYWFFDHFLKLNLKFLWTNLTNLSFWIQSKYEAACFLHKRLRFYLFTLWFSEMSMFLFDDSFWIFLNNYSAKSGFVGLIETICCWKPTCPGFGQSSNFDFTYFVWHQYSNIKNYRLFCVKKTNVEKKNNQSLF